MPVSFTNVVDGTPIDFDALRAHALAIETYVNEGIEATDFQTTVPWVQSTHIFKPDFRAGAAPRVQLTSGEIHHRQRTMVPNQRSIHHSEVNTPGGAANQHGNYVSIEGMQVSFSTPDAISGGSPDHRVIVRANWFVHEIGGNGVPDDAADHCSDFVLMVDGSTIAATARDLYTASDAASPNGRVKGAAVKQYSISYPAEITTAGVHDIGVKMRMYSRGTGAEWRHVFVWARTLVCRWRVC